MKQGKIVIPPELQPRILDWYHEILVHPGENRMEKSLTSLYYWKNLKKDVHQHCKHCKTCQLFKTTRKTKYGLLPAKTAEVIKWSRVNVDLWGPKTVHNKNGKDYKIHVLTMIDPVTGWFEIAALKDSPNAYEVQRLFDSYWLARYPRPREIGFDNGSEFKAEFKELCQNMGLQKCGLEPTVK